MLINLCGSLIGGALALAGLLGAVVAGLFIVLMKHGHFDEVAIEPAASLVLRILCCELNSVVALEALAASGGTITVINSMNDEIIPLPAALNSRVGNNPGETPKLGINSLWYKQGGHSGTLAGSINSTVDIINHAVDI